MPRVYLDVDISDAMEKVNALRMVFTDEQMKQLMMSALNRTGKRVRTIVKREVPKDYEVTPGWVGSQIGGMKIEYGATEIKCSIPVTGKRGIIGGRYKAKGGAHGWNVQPGKRYKITSRIVKGQRSTLPEEMSHQGGQPPFRNYNAPSLNGLTFTRKGKDRLPIAVVGGLAVPQMPLNKSQEGIQDQIMDTLMDRIDHEYDRLMKKIGAK